MKEISQLNGIKLADTEARKNIKELETTVDKFIAENDSKLTELENNKLDTYTPVINYDRVYMADGGSTEFKIKEATNFCIPWSIARRDGNSGIEFQYVILQGDTIGDNDAAKKSYVDGQLNMVTTYIKTVSQTTDKRFTNPVLTTNYEDHFPDPTVWGGDDGYFYAASTGFRKHLFRSTNLVDWEDCGYDVIHPSTVSQLETGIYTKMWAPSVCKVGNLWVMLISVVVTATTNPNQSAIYVLTSKKCNGPFKLLRKLFDQSTYNVGECIDPFLDYDPILDKYQLYFGSTGGIHRIDMDETGLNIAENALLEHVAGLTSSQDASREKVFEAPFVYYRNGYKYLFVSSGKTWENNYKLKVGRATLMGPSWTAFANASGAAMKEGNTETLLKTDPSSTMNSPGHNGNIFVDRLGRTYMFYHAHTSKYTSGYDWKRAMFLQRLKWDDSGWPYFDGATIASSEACPYLPQLQRIEYGS